MLAYKHTPQELLTKEVDQMQENTPTVGVTKGQVICRGAVKLSCIRHDLSVGDLLECV